MTRRETEELIRQMEWPVPSEALRARVLVDARPPAAPVTWSDRVWFSQAFRWSAAAAAIVLISVGGWPGSDADTPQTSRLVTAEAEAIRTAAIDAGLPADAAALLAKRAMTREWGTSSTRAALREILDADGGH